MKGRKISLLYLNPLINLNISKRKACVLWGDVIDLTQWHLQKMLTFELESNQASTFNCEDCKNYREYRNKWNSTTRSQPRKWDTLLDKWLALPIKSMTWKKGGEEWQRGLKYRFKNLTTQCNVQTLFSSWFQQTISERISLRKSEYGNYIKELLTFLGMKKA